MVITKQPLLHFPPKNEEINRIRRANYTHAIDRTDVLIATGENLSGNPEIISGKNY